MKIKLSEEQFNRLFKEDIEFKGGDMKEYPGSEVTTTTPIDSVDGKEKEYGHLPTADKVADEMPNNHPWGWLNKGAGRYF